MYFLFSSVPLVVAVVVPSAIPTASVVAVAVVISVIQLPKLVNFAQVYGEISPARASNNLVAKNDVGIQIWCKMDICTNK